MSKKHQKHAKLARPSLGHFHKNEWSIIGTPCSIIQKLADNLASRLNQKYKVAYVDADHKAFDESNKDALHPYNMVYTDKIDYNRFDTHQAFSKYTFPSYFREMDMVLVNGNHFEGKHQIVVLDAKKEASLSRKLKRLTNVASFVTTDSVQEPYDFLKQHLPNWENIPVFSIKEVDGIADFIAEKQKNNIPKIKGLVLAGGKSVRMGQDKGLINYHGTPQRDYAAQLLSQFCEDVYISCRPEQIGEIKSSYPSLADSFLGLGPMGAILSAFRSDPESAWLVVACDLPLLEHQSIEQLIVERNISKTATAFLNPDSGFPEPLITLWEPRSYPTTLQFLAQGYSCPRKVLINSDVEVIAAKNLDWLTNVNSPEEKEGLLKRLKND